MSSAIVPVHLLCLIHGMWGNPDHLSEAARVIVEKAELTRADRQNELIVLVAQTNRNSSTYDGIDWGGERIADEIRTHVKHLEEDGKQKVVKFSICGYSLGGLLARYVIGVLQSSMFFDSIEPSNFTTIATPHIGLPRYPTFWSSLTNALGPKLLSRTGEQFYVVDNWNRSGKALLEVMADPNRIFMQALVRFPNLTIYANAVNDLTVPYVTAAIDSNDPFFNYERSGIDVLLDTQYSPLISSYTIPETPPPPPPKPGMFTGPWWKARKPIRPFLPPLFQKKFPLNLVIYLALPILIPAFICLVVTRLSLDARASKARIKLLETESSSSDSTQARLITMLSSLEKEVDDVVADLIDDQGISSGTATPPLAVHKGHPTLKPSQLRMINSLNRQLPNLQRKLVFIDAVRNSHASIISRDVKRFEFHKIGEGVLRNWADGFIF